jgi:hypothetical protein
MGIMISCWRSRSSWDIVVFTSLTAFEDQHLRVSAGMQAK